MPLLSRGSGARSLALGQCLAVAERPWGALHPMIRLTPEAHRSPHSLSILCPRGWRSILSVCRCRDGSCGTRVSHDPGRGVELAGGAGGAGQWSPSCSFPSCIYMPHTHIYTCAVESLPVTLSQICDHVGYSPPGTSVCAVLQARTLVWVAMSFSRGSSQFRAQIGISCVSCTDGQILYH